MQEGGEEGEIMTCVERKGREIGKDKRGQTEKRCPDLP